MKKYQTKIIALSAAFLLLLQLIPICRADVAYTDADIKKAVEETLAWRRAASGESENGNLFRGDFLSAAGNSGADWYAVAVGRFGLADDYAAYLSALRSNVEARYSTPGKLNAQKATEWHRISLAVASLGGDPTSFGTDADGNAINLIADGTYFRSRTADLGVQGINAYIWALIALDSVSGVVPDDANDTREDMINAVLEGQLENGGFRLIGETPDVDITAMAITALSPYTNREDVLRALNSAVEFLSGVQKDGGDFASWGQENLESTAQVAIALCTLGINPENDARFVKNGNSVLDGIMKYRTADGAFAHIPGENGNESDSVASAQALCALCSIVRFRRGLSPIYSISANAGETSPIIPVFGSEVNDEGTLSAADDTEAEEYESGTSNPTAENHSPTQSLFACAAVAVFCLIALTAAFLIRKKRDDRCRG